MISSHRFKRRDQITACAAAQNRPGMGSPIVPAIGTIASETEPKHHTIARSDLGSTYCPKNHHRQEPT
jgi:hypothetical protein